MNRIVYNLRSFFEVGQRVRPRDDYKKHWVNQYVYEVRSKMRGVIVEVLPDDKYMVLWNGKDKAFLWREKYLRHE